MPEFPELMTRDLPADLTLVEGGVTAAGGFRAGATAAGVKSEAGAPDMAMLACDVPCAAVGTFTTSRTPSHTVLLCQEHLQVSGLRGQAVVVNSGNANCANGEQGMRDAREMAELTAKKLGLDPRLVYVSSTGIIGRPLPMDKIRGGIGKLELAPGGGPDFAVGILTTDTRPKTVAVEFALGGTRARLGGSTKGAGMIYPNMATMLCYLTSDVAAESAYLQQALRAAVGDSFNMICIDGDMSTNDTVLLFANGRAGNPTLRADAPDTATFQAALDYVTRYLAREIARDGEGATKLQTVRVRGVASRSDARAAARSVTNSPLWQCALAGGDPNWGRIWAALGKSGAAIDPQRLDIWLGDVHIVHGGVATNFDRDAAKRVMAGTEVPIAIDLHLGAAEATAWGCDLTHGYIDENTSYTR